MNVFNRKLTLEEKEKLNATRQHGKTARAAWETYMRDVLQDRREHIFDTFSKTRPDDVDTLITLRHLLAAVDDMEKAVLIDIERGDFAAKKLIEDNDD